MARRLEGKSCLIVGGTTGLGFAAARRFLEEGARLVVAGRSAEKGEAAVRELAPTGPVHFISCDAARADDVEALVRNARQLLAGLDILYHVAGISGRRYG